MHNEKVPELRELSRGERIPLPDSSKSTLSETETWTVIQTDPSRTKKLPSRMADVDEAPLFDTTEMLPLHSKKTRRLAKQQQKRRKAASARMTFVDLPPELLEDILSHLRPSDVYRLMRVSRATRNFIIQNQRHIGNRIMERRYKVLRQCFPLPKPMECMDEYTQAVLLNSKRQDLLAIHKNSYQHIRQVDPKEVCTCMTCVLAWNNLCMILDLAHFQENLDMREPIPMFERGTNPQWNQDLIQKTAALVEASIKNPLCHAAILEKHLRSTSGTLLRQHRYRRPANMVKPHSTGNRTENIIKSNPKRLYEITKEDARTETDAFLEREGPPSYEFPFNRDIYYTIQAYVPNRRWSDTEGRWRYYDGLQHERDLVWVRQWFKPMPVSTADTNTGQHDEKSSTSDCAARLHETDSSLTTTVFGSTEAGLTCNNNVS